MEASTSKQWEMKDRFFFVDVVVVFFFFFLHHIIISQLLFILLFHLLSLRLSSELRLSCKSANSDKLQNKFFLLFIHKGVFCSLAANDLEFVLKYFSAKQKTGDFKLFQIYFILFKQTKDFLGKVRLNQRLILFLLSKSNLWLICWVLITF